jgi:hypothetical protein
MTYPWILHFATHTPDGGGESSTFIWNLWYFREGLLRGTPFSTDLLAAPYGMNLVFHTYTISRDILAFPLLSLFNLVVTNNLLTLFSFGLAGLGVWLLAYDATQDAGASFVAGLIYTFAPFRFAQLAGHYNLATIEWLPFYALFALRFFRHGHRFDAALAAIFALAASLTEYTFGVYLALWTGFFALGLLVVARVSWGALKRIILLALAISLIHLPLIGLAWWAVEKGYWLGRPSGLDMLQSFSADLSGFITPSYLHPLLGPTALQATQDFTRNYAEATVFLGWLPLLIAIVATLRIREWSMEEKLWVLLFWVFVTLALGPDLHWRGQALLPLPYRLFSEIPIFREARVPSRFIVLIMLALAVVASQTLALTRRHWRLKATFFYVMIGSVVMFEYLPIPLPLADRSISQVYRAIARDPGDGTVLDLPFGVNDSFRGLGGWNPQAMYFQTATGHPIVGAHVSRISDSVFDGYGQLPIISRLAVIEKGGRFTPENIALDRQAVNQVVEFLNLEYIVVRTRDKDSTSHKYIQQVFADCLERLPDDDVALGYRVRKPCPVSQN